MFTAEVHNPVELDLTYVNSALVWNNIYRLQKENDASVSSNKLNIKKIITCKKSVYDYTNQIKYTGFKMCL
jgi:hypothetical protein